MVLWVMVCIMGHSLHSTSFTIKHLRNSSLYTSTLFVESDATPVTANSLFRAITIDDTYNTTFRACNRIIFFWIFLEGIPLSQFSWIFIRGIIFTTWTRQQMLSCEDIINFFLLSDIAPWSGFPATSCRILF